MAAPTSTNEVTVRRLSSVITQLWDKIKDTFAPKSHNHNASDINAGTLPIARGGTGGSSAKDSVTNIIQGVHDSGNASSVGADNIVVASWGTAQKTSGWYTIGALRDWLKTNLGLTASDVGAASSSHSHSDYVSKSTTSTQNIKSNLTGPRFEVRDNDGNYGAFLVSNTGNVIIKGHKGNDVLAIQKKDDASGVGSIKASYNWIFTNEINASISGRASYLKDVSTDGTRTNNCYLKWSSTDISKVSPSASGSTLSETKYLAAWETESNGGNPNVNAVNAGNVTVGAADTVDGWHISVNGKTGGTITFY